MSSSVTPETATYVYCVVRCAEPPVATGTPTPASAPAAGDAPRTAGAPVAGEIPAGLPGAGAVRALGLGNGIWAVVADVPLPSYGAEEIERQLSDLPWVSDRAMAHEAVVEHFAGRHPTVPMKLFTLFAGDERATADLGERGAELARLLDRLAGQVEWGLRIRFDAARAQRPGTDDGSAGRPASGTDFLVRKKREKEGARALASGAAAAAERAFGTLARHARDSRRRDVSTAPADAGLLLDAAFLVPAADGEAFERAVNAEASRLAEQACEVTLTGPWPPYNFVGEEA